MKKVLFAATVIKMHINVFHTPSLKMLNDMGYETHVCAKNDFIDEDCIIPHCDFFHEVKFERNPFKPVNIYCYKQLKNLLNENKFDLIHCHTPVAGILTRLAARKSRKSGTKVIYTAHGFHFFKGAPLINWLIYYPIEKICSHFTDVLITINKEDYALAQKKMHAKKVCYIPGVGIDTQKFANVVVNRVEKRAELVVSPDDFMLLSVGEINKNKNHEVIIKAIAKLKNPKLQYFIAGKGDLSEQLHKLADLLSVSGQVHFLGYRNDVAELYKSADVFCFPSHREGLSVALMEVMSAGLPVVCSKIRGNVDLIKDGQGGLLVKSTDVDGFSAAIKTLFENPELRGEMGRYNVEAVKGFDIKNVNKIMRGIYGDIGNEY